MSKTILVVGATGMLGTPVAQQLQRDGYHIRVLTRNKEKACRKLGTAFEIMEGDIEQPATLLPALEGCYGVHINLAGGPQPADYERIEHQGTAHVVEAAGKQGVERLTYLSGSTTAEEHTWFYASKAKFDAEAAVRRGKPGYTIFRASWFMESLPLFVRGNRAILIGKQPFPFHWLAASDYAQLVSKAYSTPQSAGKTLYVFGPEAITMREALEAYCRIARPGVKISALPVRATLFMATLIRNAELKDITRLMAYMEKIQETNSAAETTTILGAPTTTLKQWSEQQRA